MPKKDIDYSKNVIYKICCNDLNITDIYIGHTTNLVKRRNQHKSRCNNERDSYNHFKVYKFIRENGGWDNWSVIEVDKCPCLDFEEVLKIERHYIETLNATLNKNIPTRTKKEWCENNKEILVEKDIKYRENNKDIIKEKKQIYYQNNNEKLKEKSRQYRKENKEIISEKQKEKITCECGSFIRISDLTRHKKTPKHIKLMETIV